MASLIQDTGYRMPDARYQIPDAGSQMEHGTWNMIHKNI
jgi:hypothetical protein